MKNYDILLFDLDGTLTDSAEGIVNCAEHALNSLGITEPDRSKLLRFIGPPLIDSFMDFYGLSREDAVKAVAAYRERYPVKGIFENRVYDGIPEALELLKKGGKRLAVATSKPEVYANRILGHFKLAEYFEVELDTLQNWEQGRRRCPAPLLKLMEYKLKKEKLI